jgi:hypothetical protein
MFDVLNYYWRGCINVCIKSDVHFYIDASTYVIEKEYKFILNNLGI